MPLKEKAPSNASQEDAQPLSATSRSAKVANARTLQRICDRINAGVGSPTGVAPSERRRRAEQRHLSPMQPKLPSAYPHFRHSRAPFHHPPPSSVISAPPPSFLRRQEPRSTHTPSPSYPHPLSVIPTPPLRHTRTPLVIPAPLLRHSCAGRNPHAPHHSANTHPFPNSSLPPGRGEVRWGVGRHEPRTNATPQSPTPRIPHTPSSVIPAPSPSFLRRQEPAPPTPPRPTHYPHPTQPMQERRRCDGRLCLTGRRLLGVL